MKGNEKGGRERNESFFCSTGGFEKMSFHTSPVLTDLIDNKSPASAPFS